jgi:phosphoglycerol transferase MdoB-like AlkP superfamily enzyme
MKSYVQHVWLFLKRILLVLLLYSISRLLFFILNKEYFSDVSFLHFLGLFTAGIRFDMAAIAFTNVIFLVLLIPGEYKNQPWVQKTGIVLFFTVNMIALSGNFIDARFFDFINKRSTSSIFGLFGTNRDVWLTVPLVMVDYWYVTLLFAVMMFIFWRCIPRLKAEKVLKESLNVKAVLLQTMIFAGLFGMALLGARGTGLKPMGITDATRYADLKEVPLVINTPFSIIKTLDNENLKEVRYFPADTLKTIYNPVHQYVSNGFKGKNVVVIILESFSKEYCGALNGGKGYTPCLDSILSMSLVFENAFANGTTSYEAMPAVIAGIPSLMDRPYSGSNYADNIIGSLPSLLRKKGYHTSFFHGGNNGTMGFDNFARVAGIETYFGRNEYGNDKDYDGHWGIWDEQFLSYFANKLNTFQQPFFSSVFTLSSHHPFEVPEPYKNIFREERLPILKSVRYADFALGKFFRTASGMPWYGNTLFVITADHAAQAMDDKYNSTTGMFAIPIAFFCPGDTSLKGASQVLAQQIDIMPTVLGYLGYEDAFFTFGENLLDSSTRHFAISYVDGIYQLVEGDYVMLFDGSRVTSFYNRNTGEDDRKVNDPATIKDAFARAAFINMENRIKAIVQTYNGSLVQNQMMVAR